MRVWIGNVDITSDSILDDTIVMGECVLCNSEEAQRTCLRTLSYLAITTLWE